MNIMCVLTLLEGGAQHWQGHNLNAHMSIVLCPLQKNVSLQNKFGFLYILIYLDVSHEKSWSWERQSF